MVKLLRRITLAMFVVMLIAFVVFSVIDRIKTDTTQPIISIETKSDKNADDAANPGVSVEDDVLEISVKDKEEALLQGVTAYDAKDGDITEKVCVESVSKFIEPGLFTVTYAVMDSDKHVTKATRMVRYTDYTTPEFYMKRALVYSVDEALDVRAAVGARDCIDGDISDRVAIVATDYIRSTVGVFTVSLQVSNSMGDSIYLDVTVHVEGNETMAPEIQLKNSLIYVKKGETPKFEDYLGDVTVNGVLMKPEDIELMISTNYDADNPGTYNVHYYISTDEGYEGHSILTVVVEE